MLIYTNNSYLYLMLVTQRLPLFLDDYLNFIRRCVCAGVTSVQLREKYLDDDALYQFGRSLKLTLDDFGVPLIINDRVEVAFSLNAAGVHLGQKDSDPQVARQRLGEDKIIGFSVNSMDELTAANTLPIDYLGVGTIFPTQSKKDVAHLWGTDGLVQAAQSAKHPIVAIGGINQNNMSSVLTAGAHGVAMISALHEADHPEATIRKCMLHFEKSKSEKKEYV